METTIRLVTILSLFTHVLAGGPYRRVGQAACPQNGTSLNIGYNVSQVLSVADATSQRSYEYGYYSQALLEVYNPELTVFDANPFPDGKIPAVAWEISSVAAARNHITIGSDLLAPTGNQPANPAALGVAAIQLGQSNKTYMDAATSQADYLLTKVKLLTNGAISTDDVLDEAWDEWIFQATPFLAYYAVATNNATLLNFTVTQIGLYRSYLQPVNPPANGSALANPNFWQHLISLGQDDDVGFWSSGNGYAALGMAHVLATVAHWGTSAGWTTEIANLKAWIKEITDAAVVQTTDRVDPGFIAPPPGASVDSPQDDNALIINYLPGSPSTRPDGEPCPTFGETTGTALLAAVFYRMVVLAPELYNSTYVAWADTSRMGIRSHVYSNGVMSPAINPYNASDENPYTSGSSAGQSAGAMMYASWRDCVCAGLCNSTVV